jgi:hypothetical protein
VYHAREIVAALPDFPMPAIAPMPQARDAWFELLWARDDLKRYSANLAEARQHRVRYAIEYWEEQILRCHDRIWDAQENFRAVRRHFA